MASTASRVRPALSNLAVNTFGTPTKSASPAKESTSRKRRIDEVEEPENAAAIHKDFLPTPPTIDVSPVVKSNSIGRVVTPHSHQSSARKLSKTLPARTSLSTTAMQEEAASPHSTVSSLVDYDPDDTLESQQTAATEITQPLNIAQGQDTPGPSRVSQHAETLRLRLRLAQFKVETNQINTPFSQLRVSATTSQSSTEGKEETPHPSSPLSSLSPTSTPTKEAGRQRPDEHSAAKEHQRLPLPCLPSNTNFASSRLSSVREPVIPAVDPSSSPTRGSASPTKTHDEVRTPALPRRPEEITGGVVGRDALGEEARNGVTSSVVKGSAAMGLLGLRGER